MVVDRTVAGWSVAAAGAAEEAAAAEVEVVKAVVKNLAVML